ncbi:hypothetical protein HYW53_02100 [Candidatus Giovannonibacteria bacterium]|nr:hypothetical protein [Candidatus Giovannonibacteria bacterium]
MIAFFSRILLLGIGGNPDFWQYAIFYIIYVLNLGMFGSIWLSGFLLKAGYVNQDIAYLWMLVDFFAQFAFSYIVGCFWIYLTHKRKNLDFKI